MYLWWSQKWFQSDSRMIPNWFQDSWMIPNFRGEYSFCWWQHNSKKQLFALFSRWGCVLDFWFSGLQKRCFWTPGFPDSKNALETLAKDKPYLSLSVAQALSRSVAQSLNLSVSQSTACKNAGSWFAVSLLLGLCIQKDPTHPHTHASPFQKVSMVNHG